MRFHKPIGILLLLWPTLWALWIAKNGWPGIKLFFIFVIGTILMRAAGCVINDYADRNFDGHIERTKSRPLATGAIKPKHALILFFILCLFAFVLVLFLNPLAIILSFVGAGVTILYPFTKRFFHAPQLFLGLAFAWGIPMAFSAVKNHIPLIAWELFLATFLWIVIYDTQYAMVDRIDDLKIGIHSTAIWFGENDKLIIGILQIIFLLLMFLIGWQLLINFIYFAALFISAILFIYQQVLIAGRIRTYCFQAFLNNNWVGLIIFVGIFLSYI